MHDIKLIEEQTEAFKKNLSKRNFDLSTVDKVIELNEARKKLTFYVETRRAEVKKLSKDIGEIKKQGKDASTLMEKVAAIKVEIEDKNREFEETQVSLKYFISIIPNLLAEDVPEGKDENSNLEIKSWGTPRNFSFAISDHVALGEKLGLLDFERGTRITGARFVVYK